MAKFIRARFKSPSSIKLSEPLMLELAVTPAEQTQGLMGRQTLPWNHGMLFVFPKAGMHGFWMRDTVIPLDIAWLSDAGAVLEIAQLQPHDEHMKYPKVPARYAVEVNARMLARLGVKVGDQLLVFGDEKS